MFGYLRMLVKMNRVLKKDLRGGLNEVDGYSNCIFGIKKNRSFHSVDIMNY